ncbi:ubiquitin carboxyl-terminal hydrolase 27 isoform X2 [Phragmites australis]|uniref:ubiquitin carboxyl-terminal hydrolase 27 isoform X2 n=1 Tax=Phragmites australis TaxID=29695 RepID=UPI002D7748E6|nr:ubiquitin carboxyl-terminal hydrolase 27 isoform X2 [Phragmites australis]
MGKFMHGQPLISHSGVSRHHYSLAAVAVGLGIGVAGLCKVLHSGLAIPWVSPRKFFSGTQEVYYVGGLRNLGNNCFLNVILQALASCDCFVSFLDNLIGTDDLLPEEKTERMPLIFALSSLLEELSIVRDERVVLNPQGVMHALSLYVSHFNLTRQQDASEAFLHLLISLRDEFSCCYVPHSSLADITLSHSKVYNQREGNQPECKRWKQNLFGPFDGTIGSILSCRNCSSVISGCSLVDCLKYFTVVEHLDNYRCDRCWHIAAAKYLSHKSEVDEEKVDKLHNCVDYGTCSCRHMFSPGEILCSASSQGTKQLIISQCPKILCIHLLRASVSLDGEPVKHQGHISFPLLLNLSPFAGGTLSTGQGFGPLAMNAHRDGQQALHLYRQLNMRMPLNVLPTGGNLSSQPCKEEGTNNSGGSIYVGNIHVANSSSSSSPPLPLPSSSRSKLYGLSAVVEHYGKCGGGHYAVYKGITSNSNANDPGRPPAGLGKRWFYISDGHVSQVSEDDVLGAEATLLFYERL